MTIAAILLAAGESRRMGRPKALLDWDGRPLLAYELAELEGSRVDTVVVVLGHRSREIRPLCRGPQARKAQVVVNPQYRRGPTTSIRAGVMALPAEVGALLVLRVDQPRPRLLLDALVESHLEPGRAEGPGGLGSKDSLITIPTYQGRRGHPPIFAGALIPELAAVSEEGWGLRAVMERHAADTREVDLSDPIVLLDINTPEDYQRARSIFIARPVS